MRTYSRACTFDAGGQIQTVPAILKDVRDAQVSDFHDIDAVLHLAALSNDPLGDLDPGTTYAINHHSSVRIATLAKAAGVKRFVFASSCSNYGRAGEEQIDENGQLNPVRRTGSPRSGLRKISRDLPAKGSAQFSCVPPRRMSCAAAAL